MVLLGLSALAGISLAQSPCLSLGTMEAQQRCFDVRPRYVSHRAPLKDFGDEWDKVAKAVHRLICPPFEVKPIIEATNHFGFVAAKIRGSDTLDKELLAELDASADELIRKVQLLTVADKNQAQAVKAIKRFKSKAI